MKKSIAILLSIAFQAFPVSLKAGRCRDIPLRHKISHRSRHLKIPAPRDGFVVRTETKNTFVQNHRPVNETDGIPFRPRNPKALALAYLEKSRFSYSNHAYERMVDRGLCYREIEWALKRGFYDPTKDYFNRRHNNWNYVIVDGTYENKPLAIVVSFAKNHMFIVTAMIVEKPRYCSHLQ